jgi:hypothetical protein
MKPKGTLASSEASSNGPYPESHKSKLNHAISITPINVLGTALAVTQRASLADYSSMSLFTLMMEAIRSSETSVLTRAIRRHIPEDGILHIHRRERFKSYITLKIGVLWDVTPRGYCKNRRFGGT